MNFDIAIIGGGPAGYTAAERAGANGLKAVLLVKNRHKAQRKAKFYINKCRSASCMQSGLKQASA